MTNAGPQTFGTLRVQDVMVGVSIEHLAEVCPISSLQPMMVRTAGILGFLDLRGLLVPVLDPNRLNGSPLRTDVPRFAAILRHADQLLAVGVDEITGLCAVKPGAMQTVVRTGLDGQPIRMKGYLDNGRIVSVLDAPSVIQMPEIPSVLAERRAEDATHDESGRKLLMFEAGGAQFAIGAADVYGTVPRRPIDQNALTSGMCLGSISYHNRKVPVVCSVSLLGVGTRRRDTTSELVIMQFDGDKLLGLAVDSNKSIRTIPESGFRAAPRAITTCSPFFRRAFVDGEGSQIYEIDTDAIREAPRLKSLSETSVRAEVADSVPPITTGENLQEPRTEKFLVYACGMRLATRIDQVTRILRLPEAVLPFVSSASEVLGVFALDGYSIPLVDLRHLLNGVRIDDNNVRVLLVGNQGQQVGFVVGRVHNISDSNWKKTSRSLGTGQDKTVARVAVNGETCLADVIDLIEIGQNLNLLEPPSIMSEAHQPERVVSEVIG